MTPKEVESTFNAGIEKAEALQQQLREAAQSAGQIYSVLKTTKPYWIGLASGNASDPSDGLFLVSGMATVTELKNSLQSIHINESGLQQIATVSLSADAFGSNTAATSSLAPLSGNTEFSVSAIPVPDYYSSKPLAERFSKIDPELGKVCAEIWQALFGTDANPERAAMYMLRQAWDHFFDVLAPKELVKKSPFWVPKEDGNTDGVTRRERLTYTLETRVKDPVKRKLLSAEFTQMLELYGKLNKAHERKELDKTKARQALNSMFGYLRAWADALEI